jgi:hypothetical protein
MVISDVGDEDIMMMGYMFSAQDVTGNDPDGRTADTHFAYEPASWNLGARNR